MRKPFVVKPEEKLVKFTESVLYPKCGTMIVGENAREKIALVIKMAQEATERKVNGQKMC